MLDPTLLEFALLAVVLAVTPGADTMIVLRNAAEGGIRRGLLTMVGVKTGTAVHALLAGAGIAAVLIQFSTMYAAMKWVGATYLVLMGAHSIYRAMRRRTGPEPETARPVTGETGPWRTFMEGFLSNILNPKVVLFYVAVLPQFVRPEDPVLARSIQLGSVHILASALWLALVSLFVGVARRWLQDPRAARAIGVGSGLAIAGFGIKLALSRS